MEACLTQAKDLNLPGAQLLEAIAVEVEKHAGVFSRLREQVDKSHELLNWHTSSRGVFTLDLKEVKDAVEMPIVHVQALGGKAATPSRPRPHGAGLQPGQPPGRDVHSVFAPPTAPATALWRQLRR